MRHGDAANGRRGEEEELPEWFVDMRREYLETADEKVSDLRAAVDLYLQDPLDQVRQKKLHRILHNLIGSGGSYGFPEVSSAACRMSDLLKRHRSGKISLSLSELSEALDAEIECLRGAFGTK